jgi:hypothetical protein
MVSPRFHFLGFIFAAGPGSAWALREETLAVAFMFRATFCQSDGRNQMRLKNAASVTCSGGSTAAYP